MKLIISDIHERVDELLRALARWGRDAEQIILTGDWADPFKTSSFTAENTRRTAEIVRDLIENPKTKVLLGNHDAPYLFPNIDELMCSRNDYRRLAVYQQVFKEEHYRQIRLHAWVDGWLVSHAGFNPWFRNPKCCLNTSTTKEWIDTSCRVALEKLWCGQTDKLVLPGRARGGYQSVGGVTWQDWDREFWPLEGINQIVGHTYEDQVRHRDFPDSKNICLDNGLKHVAVIENGEVRIEENS